MPVMSAHPRVCVADTRRRLLEVAHGQYMRFGFNAVTMDETAAEAGVSKKTLYQHFSSKEKLLHSVASRHLEKCHAELRSILKDSSATPVLRLKRMMDYVAGLYGELSVAAVHDMRRHAPEICQEVEASRQRLIEEDFSALLREGWVSRDFRKDIDTRIFLLIYAEVIKHILNPTTFAHLKLAPTLVFETVCKVLFEGLLTEKARKEYHETP